MPEEHDLFSVVVQATADRPLAGMTVLVVEDSRFACEAMRLLCLRSGARIRRADSLKSARRHLQLYRPSVLVVDLGLPDGSGLELIGEQSRASPKVDVILAISGDPGQAPAAQAAGAQGFLAKPLISLDSFQSAILSRMPQNAMPRGPRALGGETVRPDRAALRDDLAHVADMLTTLSDDRGLAYVTQFLGSVALIAGDETLQSAADSLRAARDTGKPYGADLARLAGLVQDRLEGRQAV
jgi:CheY-like chemotaxis protein